VPDPWRERREIRNAVLYLGDCLEILPTLPKVDLMFADPPYNVGLGSMPHAARQMGYAGSSDTLLGSEYIQLLAGCFDLLHGGISAFVTPGNCNQNLWPQPLWTMAWMKSNGVTRTPLTRGQKMNHACWEPILVYGKLAFPPISDVLEIPISQQFDAEDHPCPKPIRLLNAIISLTDAETILDPFMGSGTTGVACMNLGRKFIGIEIEPKYFDIACERIENAQRQMRMFA